MDTVEILDTTLRDGAQGKGISFSLQDRLAVAQALDELGVAWIEAGNPGSNPRDAEFFRAARNTVFGTAKLCAFGATRRKGRRAAEDAHVQALLAAETEAVVIFGKAWDLHVKSVLQVEPEENLAMIAETVAYLRAGGRRVFFDAEHFFDGFAAGADYALAALRAAVQAGAERIVLCDTNGGAFPGAVAEGTRAALSLLPPGVLAGIHAHNDAGFAVANTALAVQAGARHVQGTLCGFGERCGNTALAVAMPNIEIRLGLPCLPPGRLRDLGRAARKVAEIANVALPDDMPYIGGAAFAHKAGMHADGILKLRESFEHIDPALVGNSRVFLMSEAGGRAAIAERAKKTAPFITKEHPLAARLAERLKAMEAEGWQFEGADASFDLLVRRELRAFLETGAGAAGTEESGERSLFCIKAYRVTTEHPASEVLACSHGWVKVQVDGREEIAASEGDGPVNALDGALRRALGKFYPELERVRLSDYKVRVIDGGAATAARVRVLIESTDGAQSWSTVGVSADIIDASRAALVDSIEYKLISDIERNAGNSRIGQEVHGFETG